ncbi:prepilin-type N-terminal cleavage/methylation domain-containing protein [Fontimonas sp. SYSU GA230001]|uniref:type IV pilus modification PilV family protein n=1 Tax=Fontimonas sp. SYSU GA230001 TaxID=3142450 RepID=UPI0032B382B4
MRCRRFARCRGFSMLEVLITLVILSFGLLGLINLQIKLQLNEVESYQRGQALVLLEDMASRMRVHSLRCQGADCTVEVNRLALYGTGSAYLGVGSTVNCGGIDDAQVSGDCSSWDALLKGAAIQQSGTGLGAMTGARGCIEQLAPGNPANGSCEPALYRVSLAWQGLQESAVPELSCGEGLYGAKEGYRRVISTLVQIGTPACLPPS